MRLWKLERKAICRGRTDTEGYLHLYKDFDSEKPFLSLRNYVGRMHRSKRHIVFQIVATSLFSFSHLIHFITGLYDRALPWPCFYFNSLLVCIKILAEVKLGAESKERATEVSKKFLRSEWIKNSETWKKHLPLAHPLRTIYAIIFISAREEKL